MIVVGYARPVSRFPRRGAVVLVLFTAACTRHGHLEKMAVVAVNGPYDFHYGLGSMPYGLVLRYDECPEIEDASRLEPIATDPPGAEPPSQMVACLKRLKVGSRVAVRITTTRNWPSGSSGWHDTSI